MGGRARCRPRCRTAVTGPELVAELSRLGYRTQVEMSRALGVSEGTVSLLKVGKRKPGRAVLRVVELLRSRGAVMPGDAA